MTKLLACRQTHNVMRVIIDQSIPISLTSHCKQ